MTVPMRPEQREHYMDSIKQAILRHQEHIKGKVGLTATWLYTDAGELYVRPMSYHSIPDVGTFEAYDFANLNVNQYLRGFGIMIDTIEWWHTQHDMPMTYIETVTNEAFANSLRKRGWTEVNQWGVPCFYRLR